MAIRAGDCAMIGAGLVFAAVLGEHANSFLGFALELGFVHGEIGRRGNQRVQIVAMLGPTQGQLERVGNGIAHGQNEDAADGRSGKEFPPAGMKRPLAKEGERRVREKMAMLPSFGFVEDAEHLIAVLLAKIPGMQANENPVDEAGDHGRLISAAGR